jgi:type IX secretion system PorP/SprF family membrane protein
MRYYLYIIIFLCLKGFCQQTPQYTQFTFNKYGYNPAAAGTNINGGIEVMVGTRKQWVGFEHAPFTNFLSVNYTIKPERSYKRWHNVGFYMSKEQAGIFRSEGYYLSYTLHLPITKRYNMSFGVFGGVRNLAMDRNIISMSDPVYAASYPNFFFAYPDFIPGIRIYSKKMFFDVSVQQIFKVRQVQGDKQIGNKSVLTPQLYMSYGRKFKLDNGIMLVPALNVHSSFLNIPSMELNVMAYYRKRIGVGATIRNKDFISGILQVRILKNVVAGFAYDYSISRVHSVAPNTVEFMIGLTPMMTDKNADKASHSVAKCPNFDF